MPKHRKRTRRIHGSATAHPLKHVLRSRKVVADGGLAAWLRSVNTSSIPRWTVASICHQSPMLSLVDVVFDTIADPRRTI